MYNRWLERIFAQTGDTMPHTSAPRRWRGNEIAHMLYWDIVQKTVEGRKGENKITGLLVMPIQSWMLFRLLLLLLLLKPLLADHSPRSLLALGPRMRDLCMMWQP